MSDMTAITADNPVPKASLIHMPLTNVANEGTVQSNPFYHFVLSDLILCVPSTIFPLYRDGSSSVEPVLS